MERRQIENFNEIIIRCFPRSFDQFMVNWYVDEVRNRVGPIRYFRLVQKHTNQRLDTVCYMGFYREEDHVRCLTNRYPWLINPQDTSHWIQFRPNITNIAHEFNNPPFTEIVVLKYLRNGTRDQRRGIYGDRIWRFDNRDVTNEDPQEEVGADQVPDVGIPIAPPITPVDQRRGWIVFEEQGHQDRASEQL